MAPRGRSNVPADLTCLSVVPDADVLEDRIPQDDGNDHTRTKPHQAREELVVDSIGLLSDELEELLE